MDVLNDDIDKYSHCYLREDHATACVFQANKFSLHRPEFVDLDEEKLLGICSLAYKCNVVTQNQVW